METPLLTIISPVYNEEKAIPLFWGRLAPVLVKLSHDYDIHLVFLNNASTDHTLEEIKRVREQWPQTYVITMSRNVGYHASLECGLRNTKGDLFVPIDVDCEDPPEMILEFVEKHRQGCDIVYGERVDREEPQALKAARKLFYRLLHALADDEIILDMAEFSLFTWEVRNAVMNENSSFPFLRAAIGRVGFRRAAIPFKRQKRIAGRTHYNLMRMSIFAVGGILSASTLFLRLPIYILPFWIVTLAGMGAAYIHSHSQWWLWGALTIFATYLGGTAAFTALYVARTYRNGLQRPNAFIDHSRSVLQPTVDAAGDLIAGSARADQVLFKRQIR